MYRLIVTDNAQCGAWNTWCAANKRSRNARTSHSQNPSFSDAVQFFLHIINTDAYSEFNIKASLYSHFEQLLGTAVKPLQLMDNNFTTKLTHPENILHVKSTLVIWLMKLMIPSFSHKLHFLLKLPHWPVGKTNRSKKLGHH